MADAARNLSPLTMDSKTLDSYSSALMPVYVIGGVVVIGAGAYKVYKWSTTPSQPDTTSGATAPLLSSAPPVTGGRRTRRRHRKNHSRK